MGALKSELPSKFRLPWVTYNRSHHERDDDEDTEAGITAEFKELAVKVGIAGLFPAAWQEPEVSYGYQVVEAVHTINQTTAAFRLSIKREERPQGDLFEPATGPYAYHVVASHWLHEEQSVHAVLVRHNQRGQAKPANRKAGIPQLLQELLKRQYPVRVLYMAGHWLDINSLDDVV